MSMHGKPMQYGDKPTFKDQPIEGGEKYRPKAEKMPKLKKESDLDSFVFATLGGMAVTVFVPELALLGYVATGLGIVTTAMEFNRLISPYRKLFINTGLVIEDRYPKLLKKRITPYGYCLTFSLPMGLSTDDFEKKKLRIEQYLNRKIDISYDNWRVYIKVYEVELEHSPKYKFIETKRILEFAIGIVFGGTPIIIDLEKVIHLLIAGETGSGKSTLLRGIITSLILANRKIILHLIDLKNGAEFNVFRKCKQVKTFSRNIVEAEQVLYQLIKEVDRRYDLFYENDVVDIKEYNQIKGKRKLDYQICIIDEFADLQNEKDSISIVETLAAKARACGIHLIIATQRPDMKVLNGRIKANIPGTVGLKTKNDTNSRIVIGQNGLEKLRGFGHGYFDFTDMVEFQSFYLTVSEARELVRKYYIEKEIKKEQITIGEVDLSTLNTLGGD